MTPIIASPKFSHRIFRDFFPPPRFLEMPAVGLDISDRAVSFIELKRRPGGFGVGQFGRRELPRGAIAAGYVNDKDAVARILRELREQFRLDFVNASLSEEKAYLYKTRIPYVSPREMRGAIEFTLEENVPIPPAEAVFDYTVIQDGAEPSGNGIVVSVTVLPRAVASAYTELLFTAGITPLSFEIEAQAMCRAVIAQGDRGTYLVANLEDEKTGLFIISGEAVHFTATVAIGAAAISGAPLKPSTAPLSATKRGAAYTEKPPVAFPEDAVSLPSLARPVAALRAEISKLTAYWQTHAGGAGEREAAFQKMLLCGGAAALPGFDEYLSRALGMTVETANVWRNAFSFDEYIPPIPFADSLDYAAAVGLALPRDH